MAAEDLSSLLAATLGHPPPPEARFAVAVSGGPDSMGLLAMAIDTLPGRITALTVDHGLRAEAAADAAHVGAACAERAVPHHVLAWTGPHPATNIQAEARAARYRLMTDWCVAHDTGFLLTAHHAEDQAETLLMRLARGSGIAGLSGIRRLRPLAPGVMLVRPVIGLPRCRLADAAHAAGLLPLADPSNHDPRHDRTHVRALLARESRLLPVTGLARSAKALAAAEAALDWAADRAWASRVQRTDKGLALDLEGLPPMLQGRLLARALADFGAVPRGSAVARLLARGGGTLAGVRVRTGPLWQLSFAPARTR
ncbi:tRNA lysidine(34) synthetase TilS [Polymorphobacter sp.]|uniref:tRNA lysidine(34) synthetase TilS n=1 Tax=Polymorphobacter sp. TaxID=1909290 RepID=UPI003F722DDE